MYKFIQRGGGPRTPEGRAASSQNAISMGAYARHVVLPGEDAAQFDELLDRLTDEYEPEGILEASLVRDIATHIWRKIRIERLESFCLREIFYDEVSSFALSRNALESDFAPTRSEGEAKRAVIDRRLYTFVLKHNTQRPIEDINRSLFKVMSELRRQQEWRLQKRSTILDQCMTSDDAASDGVASDDVASGVVASDDVVPRAIAAEDVTSDIKAHADSGDVEEMASTAEGASDEDPHKTD